MKVLKQLDGTKVNYYAGISLKKLRAIREIQQEALNVIKREIETLDAAIAIRGSRIRCWGCTIAHETKKEAWECCKKGVMVDGYPIKYKGFKPESVV